MARLQALIDSFSMLFIFTASQDGSKQDKSVHLTTEIGSSRNMVGESVSDGVRHHTTIIATPQVLFKEQGSSEMSFVIRHALDARYMGYEEL